MSLNITPELLKQAQEGEVNQEAFIESIRQSLPYAFGIVEDLAKRLAQGQAEWVEHSVPPPTEQDRAQLLRMIGGDAIRGAVERYFGIKLAFQNCHKTAIFRPEALESPAYQDFISIRSQILNQTPELIHC
ncbi:MULTISPECIES: SCO5389 family protein [Moorena]|uniref:Uncharacterized protein n=1 Tax=Moorena producens 3L TaxID=489825 RepID=F4XKX7_9CYAN|nr:MULTISPECIES: SCO5389 family protein [Moorena]EGJ34809.1 hypothetical protein LYNGBM3L_12830 [Moorena producens 3L]NEP30934.1 hypothetical protein [Moorena sp. SIO3B2]NEP68730.1 hypothetical protein [Moorena sp. SIO3A5]NEQ09485.1 hypothetical protein [Moorena sp. SIO4E2]OLT68415.1 hypothetical protein BI334_28435 [Moorena producens 3L]